MERLVNIDNESSYGITSSGKIWSFPLLDDKYNSHDGKWIKTSFDKDGYEIVHLSRLKKQKNKRVHRLVAIAFIENPLNYKQVNHIDCNKKNNHYSNLEWVSGLQNIKHSVINGVSGRGTKHKGNQSGYVGVRKSGNKWSCCITVNSEVIYLGTFEDKNDAAISYNNASIKYHGNTGKLNIIKD